MLNNCLEIIASEIGLVPIFCDDFFDGIFIRRMREGKNYERKGEIKKRRREKCNFRTSGSETPFKRKATGSSTESTVINR